MRRRTFITFLGGAATAWPFSSRAQQADAIKRIGVLMGFAEDDREGQRRIGSLQEALHKLGWIDGRNVEIHYRWAAADPGRTSEYAKELVGLAPSVIITQSTPPLAAVLRQTRVIPIVFVGVTDPVEGGFVSSFARPGGNATGFTNFEYEIGGKWVEILEEIAPQVKRFLVFVDEQNAASRKFFATIEAMTARLGLPVSKVGIRSVPGETAEIERAIGAFATEPDGGLIYVPGNLPTEGIDLIIALSLKYRLPAVYPFQYLVANGGLASYGIDQLDLYRQAASYVGRILKGAIAADLPVQQPTKFELVINLKTAKAIGLAIPESLLLRADEVIE